MNKAKLDNTETHLNPAKTKSGKKIGLINAIFFTFAVIVTIGSVYLLYKFNNFWPDLQSRYTFPANFVHPKLSDLNIMLYLVPIITFARFIIEKFIMILAVTYIQKSNHTEEFQEKYKRKLTNNIFKFLYFVFSMTIGWTALSKSKTFPVELLGSGDLMNCFTGFPDMLFFEKPDFFDFYYLFSLSYVTTDFIFLIFIHDIQSDFSVMLAHHISTIHLVSFSYLTSYSQIGILIIFIHDFSDIFIYITRVVIHLNAPDKIKLVSVFFMVVFFIYLRFFVLVKVALYLYWYCPLENEFIIIMFSFLQFLFCMHVYWICLIFGKILKYKNENEIEDLGLEKVNDGTDLSEKVIESKKDK